MQKIPPLHAVLIAAFFNAFGYFFLMSVMAILFLGSPFHFSAGQIAILLGLLGLADGFSLFWMPVIQRLTYRQALLIALPSIGCSLIGIAIEPQFVFCIFFLIFLGLGSSLGALSIRLWISSIVDEQKRIIGFSNLYRIHNAAGGVAPLLVFALPYQHYSRFIFMISGLLYLCGGAIIYFLFRDYSRPVNQPLSIKQLATSLVTQFQDYKKALLLLLVYFCFIFFFAPYYLLPYYYKQYQQLPHYIGFVIALNPILVVLFQGKMSKIFFRLHQWKYAAGVVLSFVFASVALFSMYLAPQQYGIWTFIVLITFSEMLLEPQLDFLLSQNTTAAIRPVVFALAGIVWALSRSAGESSGVLLLNTLSLHHWDPALWLLLNGLLAAIVAGIGIWHLRACSESFQQ